MARQLDAVTAPININVRFPFFGEWYDVIRVWSHGLILFGNITYSLPHNPPGPFPLRNFVCAAPYWADTDISQDASSNIFYREITDDATLIEISSMIRHGFPLLSANRMLWAFVATWYRVPGHQSDPGRNTYQAIIATNGIYSFTLYTYNQLQWSAGLWGGYPQVGFNAGDQVNFFTVENSFSADIINIAQESNVGLPGRFIFLTNGNISDIQCNTTHGLQTSPFRGSMHGGYQIRLFGICFPEPSYIVQINGQEITDCQVTTVYIACTMPIVSEGRLSIQIFTIANQLVGETSFLSILPESNADLLLNNHGDLINKPRFIEDRRLELQFNQNTLTTNYLFRIIIYDYSSQYIAHNNTFYNTLTRRVDLGLGSLNLSTLNNLTIHFQSIFPITGVPNDQAHMLDITFELIQPNITLNISQWKGTQQFIARTFIVPYTLFSSYCPSWSALQSDIKTQNITRNVPQCPCRIRTTWDDEQFGFNMDPVCDGRKSDSSNCQYQRGARGCYQRKSSTSDGGAHCCYDNGGIMINDVRRGGGSIKEHYPETWKTLSTFHHFFFDFLPYFSCCGISTEVLGTCTQYMRYRPAGTCVNLIPLPPVTVNGDPHFSTLDGNSYTFNGHGEYSLLRSLDGQFEIQVRLAQLVNASGSSTSTSTTESGTVISAFVIQNEDQPQFTPLSEPDELLSSSLIYSDDHQLILRQRDANSYSISYGESGLQFIVYLRPQFDFLDFVSIIPSTFKDKKKFQGILGGFDGLAYANGTNVSTSLNDDQALFTYGESWRTTSDSSLFYYRFQDSHAEHQDLNYRPMFKQDLFQKYANTDRYHMAEEVCRNMTHEQQCMFDVLITNDATMGQMHEKYEMNIQLLDEYIELVTIDIEISELTTSTSNSEITSKPQNSAMKYFTNEIWKIALFVLAVIYY
ncbi:unnamed protein product [Adineta steineri]|uniref:Uncharacterized protein n=1 Tax=Adineta steineri TaxID=433720 RepID=A0A815QFY8_9BILA|nr:unnamed protein product [Adineta steineri]CAF1462700.1 unnamed protein product [Adineta steineri]